MTPLDALRSENQQLRQMLSDARDDYAALKREATLEAGADLKARLQMGLQITPAQARIAAALYLARGKSVSLFALQDAMAGEAEMAENTLRVQVSKLRQRTGQDGLAECVKLRGYRMTPEAIALCDAIVNGAKPLLRPRPHAGNQRLFSPEQEAEIRLERGRVFDIARKWGCSENHVYKIRRAAR